jgi:GxxExxY protein
MGAGFLEAVHQECLGLEFQARSIPFVPTPSLSLNYRGTALRQRYQPDFRCFEKVIVEIKPVRELAPERRAQSLNYLKATALRVGLSVNFGSAPKAQMERFVL